MGAFLDNYGQDAFSSRLTSEYNDDRTTSTRSLSQNAPFETENASGASPLSARLTRSFYLDQGIGVSHTVSPMRSSWPAPSPSPQRNSQLYYGFTPANNTPRDASMHWASRSPQEQSYTASPTSYTDLAQAQSFSDALQQGRGFSASYSPPQPEQYAQQRFHESYRPPEVRRESEATDAFASANDFALFVEATSSLTISSVPPPTPYRDARLAPSRPEYRTQLSAQRLDAPLPPLPAQAPTPLRSRSSPAPSSRQVMQARVASISQLSVEAFIAEYEDQVLMGNGDFDDDEELPNYEQSQAEATRLQRREAARRAQELDDAWHRSRRRRM